MIRRSPEKRWATTILIGGVVAFMLVGAIANAVNGVSHDAVWLVVFAGGFATIAVVPWLQFLDVTADGLRYRNLVVTHAVPWNGIVSFTHRRLLQRGGGAVVVARLRSGRGVTLRATGRPTRYNRPESPGQRFVSELTGQLNEALARASR